MMARETTIMEGESDVSSTQGTTSNKRPAEPTMDIRMTDNRMMTSQMAEREEENEGESPSQESTRKESSPYTMEGDMGIQSNKSNTDDDKKIQEIRASVEINQQQEQAEPKPPHNQPVVLFRELIEMVIERTDGKSLKNLARTCKMIRAYIAQSMKRMRSIVVPKARCFFPELWEPNKTLIVIKLEDLKAKFYVGVEVTEKSKQRVLRFNQEIEWPHQTDMERSRENLADKYVEVGDINQFLKQFSRLYFQNKAAMTTLAETIFGNLSPKILVLDYSPLILERLQKIFPASWFRDTQELVARIDPVFTKIPHDKVLTYSAIFPNIQQVSFEQASYGRIYGLEGGNIPLPGRISISQRPSGFLRDKLSYVIGKKEGTDFVEEIHLQWVFEPNMVQLLEGGQFTEPTVELYPHKAKYVFNLICFLLGSSRQIDFEENQLVFNYRGIDFQVTVDESEMEKVKLAYDSVENGEEILTYEEYRAYLC